MQLFVNGLNRNYKIYVKIKYCNILLQPFKFSFWQKISIKLKMKWVDFSRLKEAFQEKDNEIWNDI